MADQRLTDKTALTTPADGDLLEIIDVSDTSANAAGTTKKITKLNLLGTPFAGAFTDLSDVDETTLTGNEGKVPMVTVDQSTDPNTTKINFERLPTFTDLLGGNAIIKGGIVYSGTGLTYRAWATSYIIDGRYLDIPVSANVTQATADATNPRIDVFVVEVTTAEPPVPSIVIVEGTPAANPVKPSIDLSTQVEISFRTVAALATTDTDAVTEVVYNENTGETAEWDLTDTPTGANMADTTDPAVGTVAITLPSYTSDTIEWTKDALYTYVGAEMLSFYMRITTGLTPKSAMQFKLRDNSTGYYYLFSSKIVNLRDYGFVQSDTDWQLIQIPLSAFAANTRTQTQYDEFEITFTATPIIELDWIVIQGSVINPSNLPVLEVVAGDGITVDSSDGQRPIVSGTVIRSEKLTMTSAMLLASSEEAQTLMISALGVGTYIRPMSADFRYRYGTTTYTTGGANGNISIGYASDYVFQPENRNIKDSTSDFFNGNGQFWINEWEENVGIYVWVDVSAGNELTAGDGEVDVWLTYEVITTT